MEKQCRYCSKSYPESDFGVAKTIAGKVYRRRKCRYCYRETKNILKGRRRGIIDQHKSKIGCNKCGIKDVRVLEFHHIDSKQKDFAIADYYYHQFGETRLVAELKKCEVLCANCHRIFHFEERLLK